MVSNEKLPYYLATKMFADIFQLHLAEYELVNFSPHLLRKQQNCVIL